MTTPTTAEDNTAMERAAHDETMVEYVRRIYPKTVVAIEQAARATAEPAFLRKYKSLLTVEEAQRVTGAATAQIAELRKLASFMRSVILSGEAWHADDQKWFDDILAATTPAEEDWLDPLREAVKGPDRPAAPTAEREP